MKDRDHNQVTHAIRACRDAGLPVIHPADCTCSLRGRLVILVQADGLRVVWPYDQRCPIHRYRERERPRPAKRDRTGRSRSQAAAGNTTESDQVMSRAVPDGARRLAAELDALFGDDAALAAQLNAIQERLQSANDRLWWALHPDALATVYGEDPAAVDVAFAAHRSEVLGTPDPLATAQQVHWQIRSSFSSYQAAAEERRRLAADIGEVIQQLVDSLVAAGWSEVDARTANVHELAIDKTAIQRRN
jgi:hypothetical protein